jgi:beta-glucanase (GH16 family)
MDHLSPSSVERLFRKVAHTFKGRPTRSFLRTPAARYSIVVLAAALGGFLIAYLPAYYTPKKPVPASTVMAPQQKTTSNTSVDAPVQNNPLFATHPSWSQNYAGQTSGLVDPLYWNVLVGPFNNSNQEQQYYTNNQANLRVDNGALRLIATHETQPEGYKYGSARIETQGKQSFLYGRIDITAKLPSGAGTWPAVWLLPANDTYAKKSPNSDTMRYKNGGEIDIIESVGFQPGVMYGIAHTLSDVSLHPDGTGSYKSMVVPTASTDFNKYTLLWTPTTVTFAVNDSAYYTYQRQDGADYKTWPFDQPFYLIANLAMGGTWGGMDTAHYPDNGIDNSALPASLDIRSINYYPYVGSTAVK